MQLNAFSASFPGEKFRAFGEISKRLDAAVGWGSGIYNKYMPNKNIMKWAKKNDVKLTVTKKPEEAVKNSDCIMTDKWVSMNDKVNKKSKKKILKPYQVNKQLLKQAN